MRIIRRAAGRWRPGGGRRWCCCPPPGMDVPAIAKVAFTVEDRVRVVIHTGAR
ncbi:MAG TPA: hypothetical protein VGG16_06290 [Streptosporangiaceae bacterium]